MSALIFNRNAELVQCARRILHRYSGSKKSLSLKELAALTAACRPHNHYVDFDNASYHLHRLDRLSMRNELSRQMWHELAEQVRETMDKRPGLKFHEALAFVLSYRRPSRFYLTTDAVMRILKPWFATRLVFVS